MRRILASVAGLLLLSPVSLSAGTPKVPTAHRNEVGRGTEAKNILVAQLNETPEKNRLSQNIEAMKATGQEFKTIRLFGNNNLPTARRDLQALRSGGTLVSINREEIKSILNQNTKQFTLPIPAGELELVEVDYSGLIVEGPDGEDLSWTNTAKHYQGIVKGDDKSLAAVSIFRNLNTGEYEVAGVYSTRAAGNGIIGRLKGNNPTNDHMVYLESSVRSTPPMIECGVSHETPLLEGEASPGARSLSDPMAVAPQAASTCVRLHLEVEHDVYQAQGANTTNYATGFFNIAKSVYAAEGIPLTLNYLKVWTSPDPEANISGYYNIWYNFWNRIAISGINGDLAMLVGFHIDRGVASLISICNADYNQTGVSPIRDYPDYPTYSWASATFPHEIGHLFGSPHTHACSWNGNNTAIDGCVAVEGSCARPSNQYGTIMSYCTNFSLAQGFGTQPGNLIRNNFNNATCLTDCGGTTCTYSISPTSASYSATGGTDSVSVTTTTGCTWTAASNASWIAVTSGASGSGSGTVRYSVSGNTATTSRSGTVTIAQRTFTVSQAGSGGGGTPLSNGVAISVSGAAGSQNLYYIDVPSGSRNLVMATSGGTGDADMYTKFGSAPTTTSYDCRPYASGNNETCSVATPSTGRYYVMLVGYAAYSGVTLKASFTAGGGDTTAPTVSITAPANGATVSGTVTMSASATDNVGVTKVEFYVDGGLIATDTTSPYSASWATTSAADGTHSLTARAYDAAGNAGTSAAVSVTVRNGGGTCTAVGSGGKLTIGTLHCVPAGSGTQYMYFIVPTGATSMTATTSGGTGNGDLYVSPRSWATTTNYTKRSINAGNSESVTDSIPSGTYYYYVSVIGTQSGMTIRVTAP